MLTIKRYRFEPTSRASDWEQVAAAMAWVSRLALALARRGMVDVLDGGPDCCDTCRGMHRRRVGYLTDLALE